VRFEIGGLIADERVAGGVRAVESIAGERLDESEDLFPDSFSDPGFYAALDELLTLLGDELLDLLAHRFAEHVGFAEAEAGEIARDLHQLFLIDGDAVGVLEDRLEFRVEVFDFFGPVLSADEVRMYSIGPGR
jgi:hypothetical protein